MTSNIILILLLLQNSDFSEFWTWEAVWETQTSTRGRT